MLHNIMSIYFVDILDGGKFWDEVLTMHMHALAPVCFFFWLLAHIFVCDSSDAAVSVRDNGGIFGRGVLRTYGLAFVPTNTICDSHPRSSDFTDVVVTLARRHYCQCCLCGSV